jgi:hypothetical protein
MNKFRPAEETLAIKENLEELTSFTKEQVLTAYTLLLLLLVMMTN